MDLSARSNGFEPLLDDTSEPVESDVRRSKLSKFRTGLRFVTVEPVILSTSFIVGMYAMLAREYIFERFAEQHGLDKNQSRQECHSYAENDTGNASKQIEAEASKWIIYCNVVGFFAGTFATAVLGSWSDVVGRKIPLLISCCGLAVLVLTYTLVVSLQLPISVLIAGHLVSGLSGDFSTILTCSFSYLSDVSSRKTRTLRIVIAEAGIGVGMTLANLTGGFWVSARGFKEPFLFLVILAVLTIIYVALRMDRPAESKGCRKNLRYLVRFKSLKHMWGVINWRSGSNRRHVNIALYTVCFFIVMAVLIGCRSVLVIFEMGVPFCWSYSRVGLSLALSESGYFVSLVLIRIFRGVTSELHLMVTGIVCNVASYTVLSLATVSWHVLLGVSLQLGTYMIAPILRSQISRLVSKDEVGAVFALLACAQNLASLVAASLFNGIFVATVTTMLPGATFLVGTALYLVLAAVYCSVFHSSKSALQYKGRLDIVETATTGENGD